MTDIIAVKIQNFLLNHGAKIFDEDIIFLWRTLSLIWTNKGFEDMFKHMDTKTTAVVNMNLYLNKITMQCLDIICRYELLTRKEQEMILNRTKNK